MSLVNLARLSASAANRQPLKYYLANDPSGTQKIFHCLRWAGYLRDWPGPADGERPPAYIVALGDTAISDTFGYDAGIAAQSILLGATERRLRGCVIGSIDRPRLRQALGLAERFEILLALPLGVPKEQVILEELGPGQAVAYWRDEADRHHVPKRPITELIVNAPAR